MKHSLTLALIFFSLARALGQDEDPNGYIVLKDSMKYLQGIVNYEMKGAKSLEFKRYVKNEFTSFNASQLLEFGLGDGSVYISQLMDGEYVFLKALAGDDSKLLKLEGDHEGFYTLSNSVLKKLEEDTYQSELEALLSKSLNIRQVLATTNYQATALSRAFIFNDTDKDYLPRIRYGVQAGWTNNTLKLYDSRGAAFEATESTINEKFNLFFPKESALTSGLFVDLPIDIFTQFSTRIEAFFSQSKYGLTITKRIRIPVTDSTSTIKDIQYDYSARVQSLNLPLMLRYRFLSKNWLDLFGNIGSMFQYNFVRDNQIVTTLESQVLSELELPVSNSGIAAIAGIGAEYSPNYAYSFGLEFRYQLVGSLTYVKMRSSAYQAILSYSF